MYPFYTDTNMGKPGSNELLENASFFIPQDSVEPHKGEPVELDVRPSEHRFGKRFVPFLTDIPGLVHKNETFLTVLEMKDLYFLHD